MDPKRTVLVVVSALTQNDVLYEYGARLARDEGARTLLIDYHETMPSGWVSPARERPTLADLLTGGVSLREVVVPSEVSHRFHVAAGMSGAPEVPLSVSPSVLAEGYEAVIVLTPLLIGHALEWLERAGAVLLACTPEAADSEAVRQCLSNLRESGMVPQLLVDCRNEDEAAVNREAHEVAARLGLRLWAVLEHRESVRASTGQGSDAGARGRAIKQMDDAARQRTEADEPTAQAESAAATTLERGTGLDQMDRTEILTAIDQMLNARARLRAIRDEVAAREEAVRRLLGL